jgi:uncharacterized protein YbjQ (UPF0145 family)
MLLVTTSSIQGKQVEYLGLVTGEAIMGTNFVRDFFASITDVIGGRSGTYEKGLRQGKDIALREMQDEARALGANAIIGIDLDYETVQQGMLMVVATGTAVKIS